MIVVNKLDDPRQDDVGQEVRSIVVLDPDRAAVARDLLTDAVRGEGVPEPWEALEACRAGLGRKSTASRAAP